MNILVAALAVIFVVTWDEATTGGERVDQLVSGAGRMLLTP